MPWTDVTEVVEELEVDELPESHLETVETEPAEEPEEEPPHLEPLPDPNSIWASLSMEPLTRIESPPEPVVAEAQPAPEEPSPAPEPPSSVEVAAIAMHSPPPEYPRASIRMGHEGDVLLRIHVGADGVVFRVELVESSGFDRLDEAALGGVTAWRFRPASRAGLAIDWSFVHSVRFRLRDEAR